MLLGFWHKTPCMQPPKLSGTRVSYLLLLKSSLSLHYFTKRMIPYIKSNPFGFLAENNHEQPFCQNNIGTRPHARKCCCWGSLSLHSFEGWIISTHKIELFGFESCMQPWQTPDFFKDVSFHDSFHVKSSLVTWDVVTLVLITLKTHVWLRDF